MALGRFLAVIVICFQMANPACSYGHRDPVSGPVQGSNSFFLVVEDERGQMLGFEELPGSIPDFARTVTRSDGAVIVTRIAGRPGRRAIETSINQILATHHRDPVRLADYLAEGHISCHRAGMHLPSRGGNFGGPAYLECADALLVGTTRLSADLPIWRQRGLLLQDAAYPDRVRLEPIGPVVSDTTATAPHEAANLTWEEAARFLRAIPRVEPAPTAENPTAVTLNLCPAGNGLYPELQEQTAHLSAALRALQRFAREHERNRILIVTHTGPDGFAPENLDPEVRDHLLVLMKQELTRPSSPLSGAATTDDR